MKAYIQKICILLFCCLALAVPAAFAGPEANKNMVNENPNHGPPTPIDICINFAQGCVTQTGYRQIVLLDPGGDIVVFKTPLNWNLPQVSDFVKIGYWVNPDGVKVGCDMGYIGDCD